MLPSAQTPACRTYLGLTETTCTACGCSAAAPSNSVPISFSTVLEWCMGGGGGGGGEVREISPEALPIGIQYVFELNGA